MGSFILSILTVAFTQFPMGLISFQAASPAAECPSSKPSIREYDVCLEAEACELISQGKPARLVMGDSWTKKYNMVCDNESRRSFYQSIFVFICNSVSWVVLQIADWYGRRICIIASFIVCTAGSVGCYFVDDFGLKVLLNGVA